DGIRDPLVTGVQTCALPIFVERLVRERVVVQPGLPHARSRRSMILAPAAGASTEVATRIGAPGPRSRATSKVRSVPRSSVTTMQIGRASCREEVDDAVRSDA